MKAGWLVSLVKLLSKEQGMQAERPQEDVPDVPLSADVEANAERMMQALQQSSDVLRVPLGKGRQAAALLYLKSLTDEARQQRDLIRPLLAVYLQYGNWERFDNNIPIQQRKTVQRLPDAVALLLSGWSLLGIPDRQGFYAYKTNQEPSRSVSKAENQSIVIGPQEAFTESLDTNLALIRKRLKTPKLKVETFKVGEMTQTDVAVLSVSGLVNDRYLKEIRKRIQNVETDSLLDTGDLTQLLDDQPLSPFPQFNQTERPESIAAGLADGKVAVLVDGSCYGFTGPGNFIEFFQSPEDYFNRWMSSSLLRLLRVFGVLVSLTFSAIYVSVLTYHYEIIPANMLKTIAQSRARVPFPPIYEAFFLELALEVLREAGARLPTKVGQTMGIVGGIVIGQAAVSAGLTSNVMIIVVSLSALASFVTPSYVMGNAVRVVRFPLIVLAGLWGFLGMMIGLTVILLHLLNLSSLGAPYFSPFSPLKLSDLKDTLLRMPTQLMMFRPSITRTKNDQRLAKHPLKRK